jgi:DNA polymerase
MQALEELRIKNSLCTACDLADKRRNVVFGEGNPYSPLVIVGEGPGDQEDASGRPFVGRGGQLLTKALQEAGISREQVYICNTVKCRAADWSTGKPQNRPPSNKETLKCRQWLIPQLSIIAPKVILCIGAPSAKNLIKRSFKITQERGMEFPSDYSEVILASLHPSYILRQQRPGNDGGYGLLVADMQKAWRIATSF